MWHQFWPSLFYKSLGGLFLVLLFLNKGQAQSPETPLVINNKDLNYPGIFFTYENLIEINNKLVQDLKKDSSSQRYKNKTNTSFKLDSDYLNSIILHTPAPIISFISKDRCLLYEALVTNQLKDSRDEIVSVILSSAKNERILVTKNEFIRNYVLDDCPDIQKRINEFQVKTLRSSLDKLQIKTPSNQAECQMQLNKWIKEPRTLYLCQINQVYDSNDSEIRNIKGSQSKRELKEFIRRRVSKNEKNYFQNLCSNLNNPKKFCDNLLSKTFWHSIKAKTPEVAQLTPYCELALDAKQSQIDNCRFALEERPENCSYPLNNFNTLSPQNTCDQTSDYLKKSRFFNTYTTCNNNDNPYHSLIYRILRHIKNDLSPINETMCGGAETEYIIDQLKDFDTENFWQMNICFLDKRVGEKKCFPTTLGNYRDSSTSIENSVARILKVSRGMDPSLKCQSIAKEKYNPSFLEYKSGCYLVTNKKRCFSSECEMDIVFNGKKIDFIYFEDSPRFSMFHTKALEERYSFHYILSKEMKRQTSIINNTTKLKKFFDQNLKGIIYGIGCGESLMPHFFSQESFNQCSPISFIISGYYFEDATFELIMFSSLDNQLSPRKVSWGAIHQAVKGYQDQHPLNLWTMYGVN